MVGVSILSIFTLLSEGEMVKLKVRSLPVASPTYPSTTFLMVSVSVFRVLVIVSPFAAQAYIANVLVPMVI